MVKSSFLSITLAWCFGTVTIVTAYPAEQPLADSTIVIYNKAIPESADLAKFYAQQRRIARDHLVGLDCSVEEEISREEYDTTIAAPFVRFSKTATGGQ